MTLEEIVKTMICENSLPRYFWVEAVNTACFIINRSIIRPILKRTPYELLISAEICVLRPLNLLLLVIFFVIY